MTTASQLLYSLVGKANQIANPSVQFNVAPAKAQRMNADMRLSSTFLQKINVHTVDNQNGENIGIGADLIGSNTDTSGNNRRQPRMHHSTKAIEYVCRKNNFDTCVTYSELDQWAHDPAFQTLVNQQLAASKALTLICVGFNGKEYKVTTDPVANPLMQDVNRGWLWRLREDHKEQVAGWAVGAVGTTAEAVKYGSAQEYKNLDALVADHASEYIAEQFQNRPDLVVIVNKRTLDDKYFALVNAAGTTATETQAAGDICVATKRLGGFEAIGVPYFPENTILITPLSNLSIYMHKHGKRRKVVDEPEYDRVANYESDNIDFVVEEPEACVLIDNIEFAA